MNIQLQMFREISQGNPRIPKPFIKWVGGKQSLADTLIDFFPSTFEKYYEPFLGGSNAFFSLPPKTAILSNGNKWLRYISSAKI